MLTVCNTCYYLLYWIVESKMNNVVESIKSGIIETVALQKNVTGQKLG